jgi:hypothetical protein
LTWIFAVAFFKPETCEAHEGIVQNLLNSKRLKRDKVKVAKRKPYAVNPAAELVNDAVVRDGLADHWSRILRL